MTDELIGKTIGGYEILTRIGEGGMASVYLAKQTSMNRQVALKVLPKQFAKDDTYIQRFEREVTIVSKLEHRSIIPVYDYGEHDGQPYIAMRYMPSGSVDDLLTTRGPLDTDEILQIVQQVAPALDYAHSREVLHRDLKPSNILMDDDKGAYITDFGIARVLGEQGAGITTHGVVGTPSYMSPEQAQGRELDGRSDVYSLGVMVFEMATGRRPFESETPYSIAVMQVTQQPPEPRSLNPNITPAMQKVILKSLNKGKDDRYKNATELYENLKLSIEKPHLFSDTEPNKSQIVLEAPSPATTLPPPMMHTPSSGASRPIVAPPAEQRSKIKSQRTQNPLLSALIGGTIGCGMLGILLAMGVFAFSFFLPEDVTPSVVDTLLSETPPTESSPLPTLDGTSQAALVQLEDRQATREASGEITSAFSETVPTITPTVSSIAPIGVVGTPDLLPVYGLLDGQLIYADMRGEEQRFFEIIRLDLDTWREVILTDEPNANNSYPIASPDGEWIVYQSDRDGDFEIYVSNTVGGELQRITANSYLDRLASWSPDGEWIVYSSDRRGDGALDLMRVRFNGGEVVGEEEVILSNGNYNSHPRYSPDGNSIIFTTGADPRDARTWEIASIDLDSRDVTQLTNNNVRDASAIFSNDGEQIVYITFTEKQNAIAMMDANGSNQRIVYDSEGSDWAASFSPDDNYLIFTSDVSDSDQLYLMTPNGDNVQQITNTGGLYASWIP